MLLSNENPIVFIGGPLDGRRCDHERTTTTQIEFRTECGLYCLYVYRGSMRNTTGEMLDQYWLNQYRRGSHKHFDSKLFVSGDGKLQHTTARSKL